MARSWEETWVDGQITSAWLDLRVKIADHLGDESDACILNFATATGNRLLVHSHDGEILVRANRTYYSPPTVDDAALTVYRVLHKAWGVPHPSFLTSDFLNERSFEGLTNVACAPLLGRAETLDELKNWIVSALNEGRDEPVKVDGDGDTQWLSPHGHRVFLMARNSSRIELRTVLARGVGFKKAHKLMDQLSQTWFGLRFYLVQDTLVMSQVLAARPFVGEQVRDALASFVACRDELSWVADRVLSRRVQLERQELARLKALNAVLEADLAELRAVTDKSA